MGRVKVHHYVPRFLLRRFSGEPEAGNPSIWCLDRETGKPRASSIRNEAAISRYYELGPGVNLPPDFVEFTYGRVEDRAAGILERLVRGLAPDPAERLDFALFLELQRMRTPRGRMWSKYMDEQMARLAAMHSLTQPEYKDHLRSEGDERSDEEIEAWIRQTIADLDQGRIGFETPPDREAGLAFLHATDVAEAVSEGTSWAILRSNGPTFVLADHPLCFWDPSAAPGLGVSWLTSDQTEVTIPLDKSACLRVTPGPASGRRTLRRDPRCGEAA